MFKILCLVMLMCVNMTNAMTLDEYSSECHPNWRTSMGAEFIECAQLALDQKFEEGVEALRKVHGNNPYFNADKICHALGDVYDYARNEFNEPVKVFNGEEYSLDPSITERDFIYENLLRHFWINYYWALAEGIFDQIIFDYDKQYLGHHNQALSDHRCLR